MAADADEVWAAATAIDGVLHELRPWLRMTFPRRWRGATLADVPLGTPLGRSWILLGGVIPVEYDLLTLVERGPRRFREHSAMATLRVWSHERWVEECDGGCTLSDRLGWEMRVPLRASRARGGCRRRSLARCSRTATDGCAPAGASCRPSRLALAMALAETFQQVVDSLPSDWTDIELDVRIIDESRYIDAAVYMVTCNAQPYSRHDWHWRVLIAHQFGHAAPSTRPTRTLRLLDEAGMAGELAVREVRVGRAEVVTLWGRGESARVEHRRLRQH